MDIPGLLGTGEASATPYVSDEALAVCVMQHLIFRLSNFDLSRQSGDTNDFIFNIPWAITEFSKFFRFRPDVNRTLPLPDLF
jgi:hypothetical protein